MPEPRPTAAAPAPRIAGRKRTPWPLLLALLVLPTVCGCVHWRTVSDPPDDSAPALGTVADTLPLPEPRTGVGHAEVASWFSREAVPRRYAVDAELRLESWEWSEPMGRYGNADFVGGRAVRAAVRRPYVDHLPIVQARRLVTLKPGLSRSEVEERLGPGWPVERGEVNFTGTSTRSEKLGWAIHDRHLNTGRTLFVTFVDGRALAIAHPWVRR